MCADVLAVHEVSRGSVQLELMGQDIQLRNRLHAVAVVVHVWTKPKKYLWLFLQRRTLCNPGKPAGYPLCAPLAALKANLRDRSEYITDRDHLMYTPDFLIHFCVPP